METGYNINHALGAIFSGKDVRDYKLVCNMSKFPAEFQLSHFDNNIVKNQGLVGSCVAHALSTVNEYYDFTQNNIDEEMSTGYIYGNRNTSLHKGEGMIIRDALSAVKKYGNVYRKDFPYNVKAEQAITHFQDMVDDLYDKGYVNRISSYCRVKSENDIKQALYEGKPVVIAIKWYSQMRIIDGILTKTSDNYSGGHCMLIYGWNEKGWKVQNSHGKYWGCKGKCIIPYDMKLEEAWAVIDTLTGTSIDMKKPFSSEIGKFFAILLNNIWKLFSSKNK